MIPVYYIELHPVNKLYLSGYHHGEICSTSNIDAALLFSTYDKAQKELAYIVNNNTNKDYYISIVEMYLSSYDQL